MSFDVKAVDVIYAEDQEAFRMITIPVLVKAGIVENNILVAEDGQEAIDHFHDLQAKGPKRPMLVLLDVRMPIMDGNSCAMEIKTMVDQKKAERRPYVVLLTAFLDKRVEHESLDGAVQLSVPKPLDKNQISHVFGGFERWWLSEGRKDSSGVPPSPAQPRLQVSDFRSGYGTPPDAQSHPAYGFADPGKKDHLTPAKPATTPEPVGESRVRSKQRSSDSPQKSMVDNNPGPAKQTPYNAGNINIIVAGDEPVCTMGLITSLSLAGAEDELILEACSKDELIHTIGQVQGDTRPMVLFVTNAFWLSAVHQVVSSLSTKSPTAHGSKPYVVCADEEGPKGSKNFDDVLPATYSKADLEKVLVSCHRSWANR